MSFVLPSYSAVDLDVEMIDAGGLQLVQHPVNRFNNYLAANKAPGA